MINFSVCENNKSAITSHTLRLVLYRFGICLYASVSCDMSDVLSTHATLSPHVSNVYQGFEKGVLVPLP